MFTKSTVNILNILLSNIGEYQDNRPIQRRDVDSKNIGRVILPLEDSFVRKLSEGGVYQSKNLAVITIYRFTFWQLD